MKNLFTLLIVVFLCQVVTAQHHDADNNHGKFEIQYGVMAEPHFIEREFYLPVGLTTSLLYDHRWKATAFGGYMFSERITAPMVGIELAYEFHINDKFFIEPHVKFENIFAHENHQLYTVGTSLGYKMGEFHPSLALGYIWEGEKRILLTGVKMSFNLHFKIKKQRL